MTQTWVHEIKVVGWDLDGTLYKPDSIPTEMIHERQIKLVAETNGWPPGQARKEFERLYTQLHSHTKALSALGVNGEGFFVKLWDELTLEDYLQPDLRLVNMFGKLRHLTHFVLSNSNRTDQVERKLRLLGVDPKVFTMVVSTVEVGATKPDPLPFLTALERLREQSDSQIQAREVLYIGDRLRTDVWGAHRVGMWAGLVWHSKAAEADKEVADWVGETVYEVGDLLGKSKGI